MHIDFIIMFREVFFEGMLQRTSLKMATIGGRNMYEATLFIIH